MLLHVVDLFSILLAALVFGVYWGPWIALSRSLAIFAPQAFLDIVHRMDRNLGTLMTVLTPIALAAIAATFVIALVSGSGSWVLSLASLVLFIGTVLVTVAIEVPIVARIRYWTVETLPADWVAQRDRWVRFHLLRVVGGGLGLGVLVAAAM